ncbi:para-nitrobenzyl esterase [Vibrio xiamenensis]|uniref:Carboxylic ester hydrolase n=1 Tax=Vibrio xiamenensis TaxID=861298 RepID=A0A1G7XGZ5_9VIBR|nr:carboxylesterase family protein [Vibrio xiamenensis]SDG83351.1 para-nitrobenzyl esterase [Vibrio xiamenensis]
MLRISLTQLMSTLLYIALGSALFTQPLYAAVNDNDLIVKTQSGTVQGASTSVANRWLGMPYAQPPVGKLRWKSPQPVMAWQGIKQATQFGDSCMQTPPPKGPEAQLKTQPMSENCLTLNVWQPKKVSDKAKLPVMVWIHGGAFRLGASSLPLYDGSHLAQQGVIVVSLNYRLGVFSVLPVPAIVKERHNKPLNLGLLDQIAALNWVNKNIAQFGGDPDNVTIWGESAGGASVGYLLQSPQSKGLFSKAIMESGALALPEFTTSQAMAHITKQLPKSILNASFDELQGMSAQQLLKLPVAKTATMPVVDNISLKESTQTAIALGHFHHVPLLIGSNNYEAGFFPPAWVNSLPNKLGTLWNEAQTLTDGYGTETKTLKAAQLATDIFATSPTQRFAASASQYTPTWRYYFSYVTPTHRETQPGAIHTGEIPYVFGNLATQLNPVTKQDEQLSQRMTARWAQFAKTGNPNPQGLPKWPQWQKDVATLWSFNNQQDKVIHEPSKERLDFVSRHKDIQMN